MKTRTGFVSNSSSSSFILHRKALDKEKWFDEIIEKLNKVESDYAWNDSGETFSVDNDYLLVGISNAPSKVREILKPVADFGMRIEG
jgi:hypothetical protein